MISSVENMSLSYLQDMYDIICNIRPNRSVFDNNRFPFNIEKELSKKELNDNCKNIENLIENLEYHYCDGYLTEMYYLWCNYKQNVQLGYHDHLVEAENVLLDILYRKQNEIYKTNLHNEILGYNGEIEDEEYESDFEEYESDNEEKKLINNQYTCTIC